ncbi:MAG TPA: recombinase RecA [Candidatus Limnocylindria bacterium]|nr:recombinase RecA [Candidatus Limnocylindria bacterium]
MSEKTKAIDAAILQIEKQFGKGSIMKLGANTEEQVESIPSGSLALDLALGVGGYPRGRVVEIYGPEAGGKTTLALHAVSGVQRAGGTAAFIDAEHALDAGWARICGVNTDELLISQPDNGEQALEIADTLVRSGAVDLVVIDSVAALVPKAEIEGEMGDSHVGLQARLMSQALRKITGTVSKTKTTVIFINQLREKIGVMFGCFSYGTRVTLADGSQAKIGQIVNQKRRVEVLTADLETGEVRSAPVTSWFNNGATKDFLSVSVHRPSGNGRAQFSATPDHEVLTTEGFAPVKDLRPGDPVMLAQLFRLSEFQWDVVRGSLLGDGSLSAPKKSHSKGVKLRLGHGVKQREYLRWKMSLLANIPGSYWENEDGDSFWDSTPLVELFDLRRSVYQLGVKRFDEKYLASLSPLALALWYLDDGNLTVRGKRESGRIAICVEAMSIDTQQRLVAMLRGRFGIESKLHEVRQKAILRMERDATDKFHSIIARYVPTSMEYKLLPKYRGRFAVIPEFSEPERRLIPAEIASITPKPPMWGGRNSYRYDLEVAGTHNYLVDSVVVHNSPETTSGGKALKFYASIRLDVRPIEQIKNGTDVIGRRVRVKVVKNKVAPPFRLAELEILAVEGISREGGLVDIGLLTGVVTKYGAWFNYGETRLGQGRENAKQFFRDHPDVAAEVEAKVREKSGAIPVGGPDEES